MAVLVVEKNMLYCPKCNDTYQEGTQRFCTNDGSRLISSSVKSSSNSRGVFTSLLERSSSNNENDEKLATKPRFAKAENNNQPPVIHTTFSSKIFKDENLVVKKEERTPQTIKPINKPAVRLVKPNEIASGTAEVGNRKINPTGRLALSWDNPNILLGQTVKGRYYIVKQLNQDELGITYLADDKIIANKQVVVRVLMNEKNDDFLSKIFAEERVSLSHINHPNVVSVLDSGELLEGLPFIVTEDVDGFSIREKLGKLEQFNPLRTARIIRQASYALNEVHQNGILHRSLKPTNIFLTVSEVGSEQVKVADFAVVNGARKDNLESAKYLSPEQFEGKMPNFASDIYSLAVVAYEMIAGRMPFDFIGADQLLKAQKAGKIVPLNNIREDISSNIDEVFKKALAYNPTDRYPKARDFGDALFNSLALTPTSQNIEIEGVGLRESENKDVKEEKKLVLPSSSVIIPTAKNNESESEQIKIEADKKENNLLETSSPTITLGESTWEKRSPEPINSGGFLWFILLGAGVLALAVLSYMSWSYLQSRQPESEFNSDVAQRTASSVENGENLGNPELEVPPPLLEIQQPENTEFFENVKTGLKGDLAKHFRGFTLYYPKTWKRNDSNTNFLDISKKNEKGELLEQMIVTPYSGKGLFSKDKELFPKLVESSNKDLKDMLDDFKVIEPGREAKIQGGRWSVYEMTFQSTGDVKGKTMTIWGRRFWMPTQNQTFPTGFVITILATSLSPDIKGIEDVGNNGDLESILQTFNPTAQD